MNTRLTLVFGVIGVIAAILLFAAGPIVATHQALAWGGFDGGCCGGGYFYGGSGFYSYGGSGFYGGGGW